MDRQFTTSGTRIARATTRSTAVLPARVAQFALGAVFVLVLLLIAVAPPIVAFAVAALLACVWCAWLERQDTDSSL